MIFLQAQSGVEITTEEPIAGYRFRAPEWIQEFFDSGVRVSSAFAFEKDRDGEPVTSVTPLPNVPIQSQHVPVTNNDEDDAAATSSAQPSGGVVDPPNELTGEGRGDRTVNEIDNDVVMTSPQGTMSPDWACDACDLSAMD